MATDREIIAITGSSGLIGAALARRLASNYHVIGFDRPGGPSPPSMIEAIDMDVASHESVHSALGKFRERHGTRLASFVHLAAYYDFTGEPSDKYETITVRGTERLIRALHEFQVEQFVFSSTMLVHAPGEPGVKISEESAIDPTWDYPKSKAKAEEVIRANRGSIPAVFLRIAGVYTDRCDSVPLAHQIQRIYEKQLTSYVYPASPDRGQSFVHLEDLVDACERLIQKRRQLPPETTLLIGEPETLSYQQLQETFGLLIHGQEWETYRVPSTLAKVGAWVQDQLPFGPETFIKPWMIERAADHYELDITRARQLLGWEPKHSLRATLPLMVESLKQDPAGWYKANKLDAPKEIEVVKRNGSSLPSWAAKSAAGGLGVT